jgi:Gpi18-like mannosyltransferase
LPLQAERKGATATEYGLVFGIFELVVFFISPIYGQHVSMQHCTALHCIAPAQQPFQFRTSFCNALSNQTVRHHHEL